MSEKISNAPTKPAKKEIRFSASKVNTLLDCSMLFYLRDVCGWPEKQWPRTVAGSCVHSFLECLRRPRHKKTYDALREEYRVHGEISTWQNSILARFVRRWMDRTSMTKEIADEIGMMIETVIIHYDFMFSKAVEVYEPEMEFKMNIDGSILKGIIDCCADMGNRMVVADFKSQSKKFSEEKLKNNLQANVYQMALYERFKKPVDVEFLLLRFPPNKRDPNRHIQRVPFPPVELFDGLKEYIKSTYQIINNFTEKDAYTSPHSDPGFCRNVCTFYSPKKFWEQVDLKTGEVVKRFMYDTPPKDLDTKAFYLREVEWKGCPIRWPGGNYDLP